LLRLTPAAKTLHTILSSKPFTSHFGPPHPHPLGERQSVFGHEDELKVAPKGVDKNHKCVIGVFFESQRSMDGLIHCVTRDIALLKCRSLAVSHRFTDAQVVGPEFMDALRCVADVMVPFVHW